MKMMIISLVLAAVSVLGCSGRGSGGKIDVEGVFAYKVGQFDVFLLVEGERDGNAGILVGADEAIIDRFIPEDGFSHTTNAILVRADDINILIDTGTGAEGIIVDKITKLGVSPEQVDYVLLTHLHGDHFGGLQKDGAAVFPNATIYLSGIEHDFFTRINVNQNAIAALAPYADNTVIFSPGNLGGDLVEIIPGIFAIAAYGHTPGHTMYQIQSNNESLLVIGDLLHVALVQFAHPEISASFDVDPAAAAVIRRQVLDYSALNRIPVAGMHIVLPGIGNVSVMGSSFLFAPAR